MESKIYNFDVLFSVVQELYSNTRATVKNARYVKVIKCDFMPFFEKKISQIEKFNCSIAKNSYIFNDHCEVARSNTAFLRINGTCRLCLTEYRKPVKYVIKIDKLPDGKINTVPINLKITGNHWHDNGQFIPHDLSTSTLFNYDGKVYMQPTDEFQDSMEICSDKKDFFRHDGDELQVLGEDTSQELFILFNKSLKFDIIILIYFFLYI
jgi:hypothetical protein